MLVDAVESRLEDQVETLAGRTYQAADLTELIAQGQLPQARSSGFVLPLGLRPITQGESGSSYFLQQLDEMIGVLLIQNAAGDRGAAQALPTMDVLVWQVIGALAGWAPDGDDVIGVFRLTSGQLIPSGRQPAVYYQLNFAIQVQIRNL